MNTQWKVAIFTTLVFLGSSQIYKYVGSRFLSDMQLGRLVYLSTSLDENISFPSLSGLQLGKYKTHEESTENANSRTSTNEHDDWKARKPDPKSVAVCVFGAVRSMHFPKVHDSFNSFIINNALKHLGYKPDIYYHLFVGTETSFRGQNKMTADETMPMMNALRHATQVRFQLQENGYQCETMGAGRYFKYSHCAEMIRDSGKAYRMMIFMRPDIRVQDTTLFAKMSKGDLRADYEYHSNYHYEVQVMSWKVLEAAISLSQPECCDIPNRRPSLCFLHSSSIPRPNFILRRHVDLWIQKFTKSTGTAVSRQKFGVIFQSPTQNIIRTPEFEAIQMGNPTHSLFLKLHGKVRESTHTYEYPLMTQVYNWANITEEERTMAYLDAIERAE